MKTILFGSRRSRLAVAQTRIVMDAVQKLHPEYKLEMVLITTAGDTNLKSFAEAGDPNGVKGLFTGALEEALLDGRIDAAVHSLKDLPLSSDERLTVIPCCARGDHRDVLVLPQGTENDKIKWIRKIGSSSSRRRIQILKLYPDAQTVPVRGNVDTRLEKLDRCEYSALILAAAGLKRLGRIGRVSRYFSADEITPAPGQGILACQIRTREKPYWLDAILNPDTEDCATAERIFSARLGGGCATPVGAFAEIHGDEMKLTGFFALDSEHFVREHISGARTEARQLGEKLAEKILKEAKYMKPYSLRS